MDSLTQIVLGASVGEAILGRKVGYRAALWGAIAGTIPDLDVLAQFAMNPIDSLMVHRGFSHSIFFCILLSPILGYLIHKLYKKQDASFKDWSWLFFWGLFTHPLLDAFTTWGTQLFYPLQARLAFKSIFVIDPLYTFPFLIFTVLAISRSRKSAIRKKLNLIGLSLSTLYLLFTFGNKLSVTPIFEDSLKAQAINYSRIETKPMPLQNILWTANIESDSGYYIGYYSHLDKDKNIDFHFYPHNKMLLKPPISGDIEKAVKMTQGWYSVEMDADTFVIHDLRFGIMGDFNTAEGEFVFDYLAKPVNQNNELNYVIEQKRNSFDGSTEILEALLRRIKGIKD